MPEQLTEYRLEQADHRLDSHSKRLDELQDLMTRLTLIEEQNQKRLDEYEARLHDLEEVPSKRWEQIVSVAISVVVGAVIGFFMSGHGL